MSARQRQEAQERAVERGRAAFERGEPESANPYKKPTGKRIGFSSHREGDWSMWPWWNLGYQAAAREQGATRPPEDTER